MVRYPQTDLDHPLSYLLPYNLLEKNIKELGTSSLEREREGENTEHPTFDEWFRPYSTANSSTSSLSSQVTAGGTHKPSERTLKEIESKEISFGMSAGSTSTSLSPSPFLFAKVDRV